VAYAQGPPSGVQGAKAVLKYLARYVSGVAISDKRLVSHANGRVIFHWKNYRVLKKGSGRGGREGTTSLAGVEFVERYMQHVLPRGLVRIRYYGLLSNRHRQEQLTRCRALIGVPSEPAPSGPVAPKDSESPEAKGPAKPDPAACPSCRGGRLVLIETWSRVNGWPWESRSSKSETPDRPMPNTIEQFMARGRTAPTTKPTGEALRRRDGGAARRAGGSRL